MGPLQLRLPPLADECVTVRDGTINHLLFADDLVLLALSECLQHTFDPEL